MLVIILKIKFLIFRLNMLIKAFLLHETTCKYLSITKLHVLAFRFHDFKTGLAGLFSLKYA